MKEIRLKQIGIIGGLGPEATIDYYKRIVEHFHPRNQSLSVPNLDKVVGSCQDAAHGNHHAIALAGREAGQAQDELCRSTVISLHDTARSQHGTFCAAKPARCFV